MRAARRAAPVSGNQRPPPLVSARRCKPWTLVATIAALLLAVHQPASLRAQQSKPDSKLVEAPKQQHPTGAPPEQPSVNLIRVDQPVSSYISVAARKPTDQAAGESAAIGAGFDGYMSGQQQELLQAEQPEVEQAANDEQAELPGYLAEERNNELAREAQRVNEEHQLERRFGLFKKGGAGNHYGAPLMSAQYSQQPAYLSDCERCFANLNQQQPLNADLIQQQPLEPTQVAPVTIPIPVPVAAPQQVPIPSYQHQHHSSYGGGGSLPPLKSKFFNKFPFFMKGGSPNQYTSTSDYEYWPQTTSYQHYQKPSNGALYLRPAAYNCVQAPLPTQFLSPLSQDVGFKGSSNTAGSVSATKGGQLKQYQQQQSTYSSY